MMIYKDLLFKIKLNLPLYCEVYDPTMTLLSPNTKKQNRRKAHNFAKTLTKEEKRYLKIDFNHIKMAEFSAEHKKQKRINRTVYNCLEKITQNYLSEASKWTILKITLDFLIVYRLYKNLLAALHLLEGDVWNHVVLSVYFMVYCMVVTIVRNWLRRLFGNYKWKIFVMVFYLWVSGGVLKQISVYPLNELPGYNARINFN